jgi:CRISPR-associated endoribonuclease Cas6
MFTLNLSTLVASMDFPEYKLPYWMGNKFRGGFGSVLLRAICGYLTPRCNDCRSEDECLYYALYVRNKQKRGRSQPVRPIIFIPPFLGRSVDGGGELEVRINVFGDYNRYLPHIVYGLRYLGKTGLNRNSKYELKEIRDFFTGEVVYDGESINVESLKTIDLGKISGKSKKVKKLRGIKIEFVTPVEVEKVPLPLNHILQMVRRRLILYVNEYGGGEVFDYRCEDSILSSEWSKHRLYHRSKREGERFFIAYTGKAEYEAEMDDNADKLLRIGELIGAGSKSSFGMGFFKVGIDIK